MDKTTYFYPNLTINAGGRIVDFSRPRIMGILNVTPDSFFDGGRYDAPDSAVLRAKQMVDEGAEMLDIGGMSTRPGARMISVQEELDRVMPALSAIREALPATLLSIDTVHGAVARAAIAAGAAIINDVSAGTIDPDILQAAADTGAPYILMHMQGTPENMQKAPQYADVTMEVMQFLTEKALQLRAMGVRDIIADPGFGFGKTLEHNYTLLREFDTLHTIGLPLMAGVSRKSMVCKLLNLPPEQALNGSTVLHTMLLQKGVHLLRVHDVRAAAEARAIVEAMQKTGA